MNCYCILILERNWVSKKSLITQERNGERKEFKEKVEERRGFQDNERNAPI